MPDIDGIVVLKLIRTRFSKEELPVVMITAKVTRDEIAEATTAGANSYLTKPVDIALAVACISSIVGRR